MLSMKKYHEGLIKVYRYTRIFRLVNGHNYLMRTLIFDEQNRIYNFRYKSKLVNVYVLLCQSLMFDI